MSAWPRCGPSLGVIRLARQEQKRDSDLRGTALRLGLSLEDVKRCELLISALSGGLNPIDTDDLESMLRWRIRHGGKDWAIGCAK